MANRVVSIIQKFQNKYEKLAEPAKASFWFAICSFIQKGISFLTTPIFSRLLSTHDYGVFSVYTTWQNIITIFASLNLASGVYLRGLIKYDNDKETFSYSIKHLYLTNFIITFLIFILFSDFWSNLLSLSSLYIFLLFLDILLQVSFHFWSAEQRVDFKYKKLIAFTLINVILKSIISISAVYCNDNKVTARIISIVGVDLLVFGYFLIKTIMPVYKKDIFKYWKYALLYNLPLVPHYLSQLVLNQSDRIMIKNLTNSGFAGIYSLAYSASAALVIVNTSIQNSYNPWFYKQMKDNNFSGIGKVSYSLLSFVGLLNLLLILAAPEIISIMAPPTYYQAIWVIPPVAMSTYFMFLYSFFANFEFYYEKTKYMMIASLAGAILNIVLNYIYIPKYGFLAAGYTTLVCYFCYCVFHYLLMKRIISKELPKIQIFNDCFIFGISGIFVVLGALFLFLYEYPILRYLLFLFITYLLIRFRANIRQIIKR